ncbi:histidine kinase [Pedobacter sp. AW31-3R]|uniref:histidine kinase n=1 Tax=Pedobacter sp. AW31-3R TaxID=3445781 RepID=UPI003F9FB9AE
MSTFVEQEIHRRNRWVYFTRYRWVAHIAYWVGVFLISTKLNFTGPVTISVILNKFLLANLHIAIFFYLYCLYFIPYFFKKNKNLTFWILVIASITLIPVADFYFNKYIISLTGENILIPGLGFWGNYQVILIGYVVNFLLFSMLLFFMEKSEESDLVEELEQEKREIEQVKLDLLKTNISPDFMMRSLDQLKRAAIVPEIYTPESIIKFSELLRYRLYRNKQLQSPLTDELQALRDFISFISFDHQRNHLYTELLVKGNPEHKLIAALALVNILEPFCKTIPAVPAELQIKIQVESALLKIDLLYNQHATDHLFTDLQKYGADYMQLYGDSVHFNFENCEDETCRIEMILPLLKKQEEYPT